MTKNSDPEDEGSVVASPDDEARLEEMELEEVAQSLAEAGKEPLWLDENWQAQCPVPGYGGLIKYPPVMGLDRYKAWRKLTESSTDEEREMVLAFVYVGDSQRTEAFFFSMLYYRMALEMGTVAISGKDNRPVDFSDADEIPIALVAWLALTAKYWLENQLTFRVDSR